MDTMQCKQCWKHFKPKNWNQKFCNDPECIKSRRHKKKHKVICKFCWKEFETAKDNQICCWNKDCLKLKTNKISRDFNKKKRYERAVVCEVCWKEFTTTRKDAKYCSKECYSYMHNRQRTSNKINKCIDCWCLISTYRTRCKSCNFKHQRKEQYDIQYKATCKNSALCENRITKPNKMRWDFFVGLWLKIDYEFHLCNYSYDIKVWNFLIEVDPTRSHNSTYFWKWDPKKITYHQKKSLAAESEWYQCIHLFDFDNNDKVKNRLKWLLLWNKRLYHWQLQEVDSAEAYRFYEENHLQWWTYASVHYWLYIKWELINCMSFTNKNNEWYLERFASKQWYYISHWAEKLFKHFIEVYNPSYVISYSDITKHSWWLYNALWFNLEKITSPSYRWINMKTWAMYWRRDCQKSNMYNLMWFDNLYKYSEHKNDDFWKQTESELMESHWYVKLCDAWNRRHVRYNPNKKEST